MVLLEVAYTATFSATSVFMRCLRVDLVACLRAGAALARVPRGL